MISWSENLGFLQVAVCLWDYLGFSFVITSIFNGFLPLSRISLLGDYTFGRGNSQKEILIPRRWEVTGLLNYAIPVDQTHKDLVKLLSWRCKNKILDRLGDVRAWPGSFSNTHKAFYIRR